VAQPRPPQGSEEGQRVQAERGLEYLGNSIRTTKYNALNFVPKCLYEQFRRVANQFFLCVAIISLTPVSPVTPVTNVVPLLFVLSVSLLKEYIEDSNRKKKDREINARKVQVLGKGGWQRLEWAEVMVGDVIRVENNEQFPADLVVLSSGAPEGVAYIETSNLDGETNLKLQKAPDNTWDFDTAETLEGLTGAVIECDKPNNSLYTFTGNLVLSHPGGGGGTVPLSPTNVLLRGCTLRNTPHVNAVVVYTGHESKIMLNASAAPSKRSHLEKRLDYLVIIMFVILFGMCLTGSLILSEWIGSKGKGHWYLDFGSPDDEDIYRRVWDTEKPGIVGFLNFLTLLTLYATNIPISLYVSIEVIKFSQATFIINKDRNMYHEESDTPALARTSNLNEELGQVEYVFSDKTGTLTQNLMEFFKCSIAGERYGSGVTEIQRATAARKGEKLDEGPAREPRERGMNFEDERVMDGGWKTQATAQGIEEYFRALALCHTVVPEGGSDFDTIVYQAASPDDVALTLAAKHAGWFFQKRTTTTLTLEVEQSLSNPRAGTETWELLATLDFNSKRKRMSVIVREPWSGVIRMYSKGADNVILERLARSQRATQYKEETVDHLNQFAQEGLRTLCVATRVIDEAEFRSWMDTYTRAKQSLTDREEMIDAAAEDIEHSLELLGATAIEDKLQDGVPHCIEELLRANIKVWVLTGDKMETAINIAFACSLLTDDQEQHVVQSTTTEVAKAEKVAAEMEEKEGRRHVAKVRAAEVGRQLREIQEAMRDQPGALFSLIIDGAALESALGEDLKMTLLNIGQQCQAVVCCRVSPLQKALVTRLVRDNAGKVTLSIGDGANDVSMIQAAHLGVGISGNEGMQAVMASDFAIAQFRFLSDLLLVHGAQMYHRMSRVIGFFFYKNLAFTLTQFIFGSYQVFSGQTLFDDWFQVTYNMFFTMLPPMIIGVFDQEVLKHSAKTIPQLYLFGQRNENFNAKVLGGWLLNGAIHGVMCFYLPLLALSESTTASDASGRNMGLFSSGTMVYTVVVCVVNLRLLIQTSHQTFWHMFSMYGSIIFWVGFILMYSAFTPDFLANFYASHASVFWVWYQLCGTARFWLGSVACIVACLIPDFLFLLVKRYLKPWDYQILQEYQAMNRTMRVPQWAILGRSKSKANLLV